MLSRENAWGVDIPLNLPGCPLCQLFPWSPPPPSPHPPTSALSIGESEQQKVWGKVSNKWCESMCVYLCVSHVFASQQGIPSSQTRPAQLSSHRSREEGYRADLKDRGSRKHSGGSLMITQHRSKPQTSTNLCCPSIPWHTRAHVHTHTYIIVPFVAWLADKLVVFFCSCPNTGYRKSCFWGKMATLFRV